MRKGQKVPPELIERIKAIYAETGSYAETARQCGVSTSTAKHYADLADDLEELRKEKRSDIIARIAEVRALYVDHLAKPAILAATTSKDAAVIVGILTDKHQLLSGEPTERHEHSDSPAERLSRRMDELAARRRAREMAQEPTG